MEGVAGWPSFHVSCRSGFSQGASRLLDTCRRRLSLLECAMAPHAHPLLLPLPCTPSHTTAHHTYAHTGSPSAGAAPPPCPPTHTSHPCAEVLPPEADEPNFDWRATVNSAFRRQMNAARSGGHLGWSVLVVASLGCGGGDSLKEVVYVWWGLGAHGIHAFTKRSLP